MDRHPADDEALKALLEHATAEAQAAALLSGLTLLALVEEGALPPRALGDIMDAAQRMVEQQVAHQAFAAERTLARLVSLRTLLARRIGDTST